MSEYTNVEWPFLDKLRQLGWTVIDHNNVDIIDFAYNQQEPMLKVAERNAPYITGIPQDPAVSRREHFKETILTKEFRDAVRFGIAAGAAAVMTPGSELCRSVGAERLYAKAAA